MFRTYAEANRYLSTIGAVPSTPLEMSLSEARAKQNLYFSRLNDSPPPISRSTDIQIDGPCGKIPIRISYPSIDIKLPVVLFVRGAGWWAGSLDSHTGTVNQIANLTGYAVCAVDFRRTPEHSYPVQRDEIIAVIHWLKRHGDQYLLDDEKLVLFGESAGATLCLSAAQTLRDKAEPSPVGLVLFYTNAGGPKPTARPYSQWVWKQYLGQLPSSELNAAIPLRGQMDALPPIWLGVGEDDPLKVDTFQLADELAAAGVQHWVHSYPGLPHGFVMLSGILQPAFDALSHATQAAKSFASNPSTPARLSNPQL